ALSRVDHRLDGERHARDELDAGAGLAVVQDLRILVEDAADSVPAIFPHDREAMRFDEGLDRVADIAEPCTGTDHADSAPHRLEADAGQPLADDGRFPDVEHPARVAVESVFD